MKKVKTTRTKPESKLRTVIQYVLLSLLTLFILALIIISHLLSNMNLNHNL